MSSSGTPSQHGAGARAQSPHLVLCPAGSTIVTASPPMAHWLGVPAESLPGRPLHTVATLTLDGAMDAESPSLEGVLRRASDGCAAPALIVRDGVGRHWVHPCLPGAFGREVNMAALTHELRTPLSTILGLSDVALDQAQLADPLQVLSLVRDNASRMLALVNDHQDLGRLRSGTVMLRTEAFDPEDICLEVCEFLAPRARRADLELDVVVQGPALRVIGDPGRLRQILVNLVGNALKFTRSGWVCVRLHRSPAATAGRAVLDLRVTDSGPGLSSADAARVFEPFVRLEDPSHGDAQPSGAGLGLAISRGLAAAMGGSLRWVPPEGDTGATFALHVELPTPEQPPGQAAPPRDSAEAAERVVIACSPRAAQSLAHAIERCGREALKVSDLAALARDLVPGPPTVVFCGPDDPERLRSPEREILTEAVGRGDVRVVRLVQTLQGGVGTDGGAPFATRTIRRPVRFNEVCAALRGTEESRVAAQHSTASSRSDGAEDAAGDDPASTTPLTARIPVVVVDDDPDVQLLVKLALAPLRLDLIPIRQSDAVEDRVRPLPRALVLLDLQMPGMDGFAVSRRLRRLARTEGRRWTVVAFTAERRPGLLEDLLDAGMGGLLEKPVMAERLRAFVRREIRRLAFGTGAELLPEEWTEDFEAPSFTGEFDTVRWQRSQLAAPPAIVEVPEALRDLTETYRLERLAELAALTDALGCDDLVTVEAAAHRMRGNAASFGFVSLSELGRALEGAARENRTARCRSILERMRAYLEGARISALPPGDGRR